MFKINTKQKKYNLNKKDKKLFSYTKLLYNKEFKKLGVYIYKL